MPYLQTTAERTARAAVAEQTRRERATVAALDSLRAAYIREVRAYYLPTGALFNVRD